MSDSGKKRISAKEILADIRSGMDASALKLKYGLSDKSLAKVYLKLNQAGVLKKQGKSPGDSTSAPTPTRFGDQPRAEWKCPACGKAQPSEVAECPACGIVVAKYLRRETWQTSGKTVSRVSISEAQSRGQNWTAVVASIVVLGLLGASILWWSGHQGHEKTEMAAVEVHSEFLRSVQIQKDKPDETTVDRQTSSIALPEETIEDTPALEATSQPPIHAPLESAPVKVLPPQKVEPAPKEEATPEPGSTPYVTGVLRQFDSRDFKREVVEASKTYPVVFQFYSDT